MVTVYQTGSLAASLQLTATSFAHGGVIYHGLTWVVTRVNEKNTPTGETFSSSDAIAQFDLKAGNYRINVTYDGESLDLGKINLQISTLTDCVFILKGSDVFNENAEFFAETDPFIEHKRRQDDRNVESRIGNIETPLKNPYQEKGQGIHLQTHPLLANKAQFDGMPPEINVDPQKNEAAMEKQLQLQHQLQLQNQNQFSPPTAAPGA